jgi:miniconductance mechanosensitive channel
MGNEFNSWLDWLNAHPELQTLTFSVLLIIAAWLSNWLVKRILVRGLYHLLRQASRHLQAKGELRLVANSFLK